MTEALTFPTRDQLTLEGEWAACPDGVEPWAIAVLCHPHPQHGGSMRSIVISALFEALPARGVACLRFNYRGVGASQGSYDDGIGEQTDAQGAVDAAMLRNPANHPLALVGWSFGGDVVLAGADERPDALVAIAPPIRVPDRVTARTDDPRPKLVLLAANDEIIDNATARALAPHWPNTDIDEVVGASHFFIGRTDAVTERVGGFLTDALH